MELSWTTFTLELINFLVLVWILKHFLYKPVLNVVERRQREVEKKLQNAETLSANAEKLREQYETRLTEWEKVRQQAREKLDRELEVERMVKLEELKKTMAQEQEKVQVINKHRQADEMQKIEKTALMQGAHFAARLLEQGAGSETETSLIDLATTELEQLTAKQVAGIRDSYGQTPESIIVISAFPIPEDQCRRLTKAIEKITTPKLPIQFEVNPELLAGVRITIGAWILGSNLKDELAGFAEFGE